MHASLLTQLALQVSIAQKLIQRHEKVVKDLDEAVAAERAQKAVQHRREVVKASCVNLAAFW